MWRPDYSYSAIFYDSNNEAVRVSLEDNRCMLPKLPPNRFKVGVMATSGNTEIYSRMTSVYLSRSCYSKEYSNAATPSEYALLSYKVDNLCGNAEQAITALNNGGEIEDNNIILGLIQMQKNLETLAAGLTEKGQPSNSSEGFTVLCAKVSDIIQYDDAFKLLIERRNVFLEIPEGVNKVGDYAFYNHSTLEKVRIADSITSIGKYAFDLCGALTDVLISSQSAINYIDSYAFLDCRKLKNLVLPDQLERINEAAFQNCTSLSSINIPENVIYVGAGAFYNCTSLSTLSRLPKKMWNISDSCFELCTSLTEITIPGNISAIGKSAFRGCSSLSSLTLENGVKTLGQYSFYNCTNITKLKIPNTISGIAPGTFETSYILRDVEIENGFNCKGLILSASSGYSPETVAKWIDALADRTGQATYVLTIGQTNLAKLTDEQIAKATQKNWTLA